MQRNVNIDQLKKELLKAKAQVARQLGLREEAVVEQNADAMDQIQAAEAREFALQNLDRYGRHLREVDAALRRMDSGDYGLCIDCEGEIGPNRLRAVPWAERCVRCQERTEQRGHNADRIDLEPLPHAA
jgi:DnaK suppressor protein